MAMLSCPKCGFTQPADQYCASCGVDMKSWRPREKPFVTRLVTNPIFQITVIVVVVGGGFAYMRESKKAELAERVRAIEIARQAEEFDQGISDAQTPRKRETTNASESMQPKARPQAYAAASAPQAPPPPQQFAATSPSTANFASGDTRSAASGVSASASRTSGAPTSVNITYYEMSVALATSLLQSSAQQTSEGPLSIGVVPDIEAKLKNQTLRVLDSATQPLQVNQPGVVYKGALDQASGAKLGFTLDMNTVAIDENGAQVQFDLLRVLRDSGPNGIEEARFQPGEAFTLQKGQGLVVVGLLPRKTQSETDAAFYKGVAVLRPLTSSAFIGGQSETVLVFEAK